MKFLHQDITGKIEDRPEDLVRSLVLDAVEDKIIDVEKRTVTFPFSSDAVVSMSYGKEKLLHTPEAIDMSRLMDGAAVLEEHAPPQIGVVDKAWLGDDGRGWVTVRFSKGQYASEIFDDIVAGIRRNVSFGYRVTEWAYDKENDIQIGVEWMPYEVSIVAVPADPKVGIRRSAVAPDGQETDKKTDKDETRAEADVDTKQINKLPNVVVITKTENPKMKMSKEELKLALELTRKFQAADVYDAAIENDMSIDEVRSAILEKQDSKAKETKTPLAPVIGLSEKEQAQYSFVRAIELSAFPNDKNVVKRSGFEAECSRAYAEKSKKSEVDGIWVPADVMLTRDFNLTTGAGSNLVFTDARPQNFIEVLRNKMLISQLGAQVLENLVGPVAIPRQTGSVTGYWFNPETHTITAESNPTIDQVALTPRTLGAYTDISRRLLLGSSIGVESLVRNDIAETLGVMIDKAAYLGAGTNEPTGIFNTAGVGADTWAAANTPTWAEIVDCETQVDLGNALNGSFAYIMGAALRGACKTIAKVSGTSADFLIDRDGQMNGYPAYSTNQLTAGELLFGKMSDIFIGMFSGLNLQTDPYLLATSGGIRVTALIDIDLAVRRPSSFYVMSNAVST